MLTNAGISEGHLKSWLRSALHATVWYAHRLGAKLIDIEREFASVISDVKDEASAEIAKLREANGDGA